MRRLVTSFLVIALIGAVAAAAAAGSPTTTGELLSRMVTEEVEPGVYKVLNDGWRDLMRAYTVTVGTDGSVWAHGEHGFFRLGSKFTKWPRHGATDGFGVTPDGTVWAIWFNFTVNGPTKDKAVIRTFNGERWKTRKTFPRNGYGGMDVAPDGSVFGSWPDPKDTDRWPANVVARYGTDGWQRLGGPIPRSGGLGLHAASGDEVWVMYEGDDRKEYLRQFVDGEWTAHDVPVSPDGWAVGPDGTVWAKRQWEWRIDDTGEAVRDEGGEVIVDYQNTLLRFDGEDWQQFGPEDGVPDGFGDLHVAPDGSVWGVSGDAGENGGVYRFDGTAWQRFVPDLGVDGHALGSVFGPDGAYWFLGGHGGLDQHNWYDLYVITPEAVAAAE